MHTARQITALITLDAVKAKRAILDAFRISGANQQKTAEAFGCSIQTFRRWIDRLELADTIVETVERAQREGWHKHGKTGRPPESKKALPRGDASKKRGRAA